MKLDQLLSDFQIVPSNWDRLGTSRRPLHLRDVLSPNGNSKIDVIDSNWTVLDLIGSDDWLEILDRRATQSTVQSLRDFCTFDLPLREQKHVLGNFVDEHNLFFLFLARIIVMESAFVHPKLHVRLLEAYDELRTSSLCCRVTLYCRIKLLKAIIFVMALEVNQTSFLYPGKMAFWLIDIDPPLLLSRMEPPLLKVLLTSSLLQKRSIVD